MIREGMKIVTSQSTTQHVSNSHMQMNNAIQPMQIMSQPPVQHVFNSHMQMNNAVQPMHTMHMPMSQFPMFRQNGLSQQSYQHFGYGPSLSQQPPQFQILSQQQCVNDSDMFPQDQDMSGDKQSQS